MGLLPATGASWRRMASVDPRTRAPRRRVVRWLPHRPSRRASTAPTLFQPTGVRAASFRQPSPSNSRSANPGAVFTSFTARVIARTSHGPGLRRESLDRLGVPGFKVLAGKVLARPGQPFRDPAAYPVVSVAATGTHDTEPLATWWDELPRQSGRRSAPSRRCGGSSANSSTSSQPRSMPGCATRCLGRHTRPDPTF